MTVKQIVVSQEHVLQANELNSSSHISGSGEIGRRTALRWLRPKGHGSSSLPFRTIKPHTPHQYSKENLSEAIAQSHSWGQVCKLFGVDADGSMPGYFSKLAKKWEISYQHFRRHRYTQEQLATVVAASQTWADVCLALQVDPRNSSQGYLSKLAKSWGIDSSHFRGQGWAAKTASNRKKTVEEYLILDGPKTKNTKIVQLLIGSGRKQKRCEWCGGTEWFGMEIILELDHINRNIRDFRLENLQLLCPTCHAYKTLADRGCINLSVEFTSRPQSISQDRGGQTLSGHHSEPPGVPSCSLGCGVSSEYGQGKQQPHPHRAIAFVQSDAASSLMR